MPSWLSLVPLFRDPARATACVSSPAVSWSFAFGLHSTPCAVGVMPMSSFWTKLLAVSPTSEPAGLCPHHPPAAIASHGQEVGCGLVGAAQSERTALSWQASCRSAWPLPTTVEVRCTAPPPRLPQPRGSREAKEGASAVTRRAHLREHRHLRFPTVLGAAPPLCPPCPSCPCPS